MIEARDIRAGYGDRPDILHEISFEVHAGEIVAILGARGCGKSALIKAVAGLLELRGGAIEIDGENVTAIATGNKSRHRRVSYVPQTDMVVGALTVMENLMLRSRPLNWKKRAQRLDSVFGLFPHLADKRRQTASDLLDGDRRVLLLCLALMAGPRILLLDEPLAGLSPLMMRDILDAIVRIRNEAAITVLMVEKNALGALSVADRAYVMTNGQMAVTASAQDLLNDPAMEWHNFGDAPKADDAGAGPAVR